VSEEKLQSHKRIWENKPILRYLYANWYNEIIENLNQGRTLEIGGGIGNLKNYLSNVVSTDIAKVPWLDAVADAQKLPFQNNSFDNIVLFDVLHHIENVTYFFNESERILNNGGRLVIMDPYISWMSWPVYHFLHPEPVDFSQDPFKGVSPDPQRKPFDSNQAMAKLIFEKGLKRFLNLYPGMALLKRKYCAFFAYPLSGGFDKPALLPTRMLKGLSNVELLFAPLGRLLGFRILIVLEKK